VATGRKADAVHTRLDSNGRLEYYRVYTYPLFDDDGELAYVVEMRRDITRRTHTEHRLQQARKMAAIGELSTYIAHEIRNPLFAIGGFARSLLRDESLGEEARGKVNIILEEARRLDGILKAILNYAKPTEAQASEVDLNIVAGETVHLMGLGCGEKHVELETSLAPGLAQARGEPELLKQCLINMVKNSMEAMGQGGGRIVVTTGMEGKQVFVRVDDDGPGIPDDVKLRVFNPFFSTKDDGSGLGLAMTRKIVEDVGGSVRLVSRVGEGTSVTIYLRPALAVSDETPGPAGDAPSYEMSIFGAAETMGGGGEEGGAEAPGHEASAPEPGGQVPPGPLDGGGAPS
jgi:signal transduction histidine kinase